MYKFHYDNEDSVKMEVKLEVPASEGERISNIFCYFFQFMLSCSWQPSQLEKEMRRIIEELDNDPTVTMEDMIWI